MGQNGGGEAVRNTGFEALRDWTCVNADTGKGLALEVREYFISDFSSFPPLSLF